MHWIICVYIYTAATKKKEVPLYLSKTLVCVASRTDLNLFIYGEVSVDYIYLAGPYSPHTMNLYKETMRVTNDFVQGS